MDVPTSSVVALLTPSQTQTHNTFTYRVPPPRAPCLNSGLLPRTVPYARRRVPCGSPAGGRAGLAAWLPFTAVSWEQYTDWGAPRPITGYIHGRGGAAGSHSGPPDIAPTRSSTEPRWWAGRPRGAAEPDAEAARLAPNWFWNWLFGVWSSRLKSRQIIEVKRECR